MPRSPRALADGCVYHVMNRGNGKQQVFHKDQDYRSFIKLISRGQSRNCLDILAYCLMPNHFHFLLMANKGVDLSRWMHWLMTTHVRSYHEHYNSSGHIWQGRYKCSIVQEDVHLLTVTRYIERNPVRAGLVTSAQSWPWSSHRERCGWNSGHLLSELPVDRPEKWQDYVDTPLTEKELQKIRESVKRQSPYGDADWELITCRKFGLESTINPLGRPRKERKK